MFLAILYANIKEIAYFATKVFLTSILNFFLSSMEVIGKENIPLHGPIIFTGNYSFHVLSLTYTLIHSFIRSKGNHNNQFVDGAVMLVNNPHQVRFLVAESSYNKRIVGDLMKAIDSIPTARPIDNCKKMKGKIKFDGMKVVGVDTEFTQIKKGIRIRPSKSSNFYKIKETIRYTLIH
jgi:glycerol-3-phosphate O-acyltransferase/dihydroxyacetone phosphate acyltransferase